MTRTTLTRLALAGLALAIPATGLAAPLATTAPAEAADRPRSSATSSTSSSPERTALRSGTSWKSGLFAHSTDVARDFQQMRGARVNIVSVHPQRDSWATLRDTWWLSQTAGIRSAGASLEVSVPLWPSNSSVYAAAGPEWRAFGQLLVQRGERDAIITIGKEFNLPNGWHINADNQDTWRKRFREAVSALRSVPGERFRIAWTPNEGGSQTGVSPLAAWPGAKYVDIVAPDYYDQWSPIRTWEQARARFNREFGIEWWFKWARRHGADVGVSEWGVSSGTQWGSHAGGDNPFYIKAMRRLFQRYHEHLVYESYFEEPASYVASSLLTQNPRARGQYRNLW